MSTLNCGTSSPIDRTIHFDGNNWEKGVAKDYAGQGLAFRDLDGDGVEEKETKHAGNYGHPLDGTFTLADVDGDGETECVVPDSSSDKQAKGLAYLEMIPATEPYIEKEPVNRFKLNAE